MLNREIDVKGDYFAETGANIFRSLPKLFKAGRSKSFEAKRLKSLAKLPAIFGLIPNLNTYSRLLSDKYFAVEMIC